MSTLPADPRNADQIAFWNGPTGRRWVEHQERQDALLLPILEAALARAGLREGERVVDVGCGCGGSTLELGRRVGPRGRVLGLDVSAPMLARAAERATVGLPVAFVEADATVYPLPRGGFDLLFSRFGVMFFAEPARAFANLRAGLRPGGRLVFVCFRTPRENPWMMAPLEAAHAHVPKLPQAAPDEPGPFAFADPARLRGILGQAGFAAVDLAPLDLPLDLAAGGGLEAAVEATLTIGPVARALEGHPPETRKAVTASIRRTLAPHQRGKAVPLPSATWLVSAVSP
jgi:SAM-dependent methyltransferase